MIDKRGVSPVIATALLLVITVLAAALIMSFVVPFVQKQLGNSEECLDVLDGIEFAESQFNCFDEIDGQEKTGFSVKVKKDGVEGFRIGLIDEQTGSSEAYTIKDGGGLLSGIRMKDVLATSFEIPTTGGQRTYVATGIYSKIELAPVVKSGNVCEVADTIQLNACGQEISL